MFSDQIYEMAQSFSFNHRYLFSKNGYSNRTPHTFWPPGQFRYNWQDCWKVRKSWLHHPMKFTIPKWPTRESSQKHMAQSCEWGVQTSREVVQGAETYFSKPSTMTYRRGWRIVIYRGNRQLYLYYLNQFLTKIVVPPFPNWSHVPKEYASIFGRLPDLSSSMLT